MLTHHVAARGLAALGPWLRQREPIGDLEQHSKPATVADVLLENMRCCRDNLFVRIRIFAVCLT